VKICEFIESWNLARQLKSPTAVSPCLRLARRTGTGVLIAGFMLASSAGAVAQEQAPAPEATFRGGVEAVAVTVTIRDARGRVVRDLAAQDFEVIDSGSLTPITDFFAGESPVSLALLMDISGSMAVGDNIARAREAVSMLTAAFQPLDEAALFTFDSKLRQVVPFTSDLSTLREASLSGRPWGVTSLFDSIKEVTEFVAARPNRHRALLVITDGVDTASRLTATEVSGIAASIDVPVYLLSVVTPADHTGEDQAVVPGNERAEQAVTLADLARWTGGSMRMVSRPAHTQQAVQDLMTELRHQYVISFEPGTRPGWHPIEVRLRKKNMFAHTRGGYLASPARSGR
jgi:Ca-activated chloride channel family protein